MSDALANIATRADDLRHAFESGFEPSGATNASRTAQFVRSLDPLSVAAPEGEYFASSKAGATRFSRDGSFVIADGELRTREGAAVLGFVGGGARLVPLGLDPIDVALGRVHNARIDADGTLAYSRLGVDPRTGQRRRERIVAGRVALARFPAGTRPVLGDSNQMVAPDSVTVSFGRPGEGGFEPLHPFARDLGRTDPLAAARHLQEAYLSLQALDSARLAGDEFSRVALDVVK